MIDTDFSPENQEDEYDGTFTVSGNDDTAFFNMNLMSTEEGANAFFNSSNAGGFQFGGAKTNGFGKKSDTVVVPNAQTDPSAKCDHNCASCIWSSFCKTASKGLIGLGSGSFIPKLG